MRSLSGLPLLLLGAASCTETQAEPLPAPQGTEVDQDLAADMSVVRQSRVYFTHHSVGGNLLSGIKELDAASGGGLRVVDLAQGVGQAGPAFIHASGGKNKDPKSKIDYFVASLAPARSPKAQLAMMKFCYVDFNPRTDVGALFQQYRTAIDTLKRENTGLVVGHVTVPLQSYDTELKWRLFRMIGREVWGDESNAKRNEFNELLAKTFHADPIFDLARAQSTRHDGTRQSYELRGRSYYALDPSYSSDGGHLNALGRRVLGSEMIRFLAATLRAAPKASG